MSVKQISSQKAVNDYFSSLLFDDSSEPVEVESLPSELKFAHVKAGYQLLALWDAPLTDAQALCRDFFVLSCLKVVTGVRLRAMLLNSITSIKS